MVSKKNTFLVKHKENGDFNQYWYSTATIDTLTEEIMKNGKRVAFLSTPSVYFSIKDKDFRQNCYIFEFDKAFAKDPNFVFYDFNKPEDIPQEHCDQYDLLLIDPPFITRDVWEKYAEAAKKLVKKDNEGKVQGKYLLSSIDENAEMLKELLGVSIRKFRPLIPNLVYQYSFYSNYESETLDRVNEEIGF